MPKAIPMSELPEQQSESAILEEQVEQFERELYENIKKGTKEIQEGKYVTLDEAIRIISSLHDDHE